MDDYRDFATSTLAAPVAAGAMSVSVASGDGAARFGAAPFDLVIWNKTDFRVASDDPNREVVRVLVKTGDAFTLAAPGTTKNHNAAGKTYAVAAAVTARAMAAIAADIAGVASRLPLTVFNAAQFDKTNDATLEDVPGLSVPLESGKTYHIRAVVAVEPGASFAGAQVGFGGTATMTAANLFAGAEGNMRVLTQLETLSDFLIPSVAVIDGLVTVDQGGTLTITFAQITAQPGTTSSVRALCHLSRSAPLTNKGRLRQCERSSRWRRSPCSFYCPLRHVPGRLHQESTVAMGPRRPWMLMAPRTSCSRARPASRVGRSLSIRRGDSASPAHSRPNSAPAAPSRPRWSTLATSTAHGSRSAFRTHRAHSERGRSSWASRRRSTPAIDLARMLDSSTLGDAALGDDPDAERALFAAEPDMRVVVPPSSERSDSGGRLRVDVDPRGYAN
jgi:hypothetical protein